MAGQAESDTLQEIGRCDEILLIANVDTGLNDWRRLPELNPSTRDIVAEV
jgi:hypothetical protein